MQTVFDIITEKASHVAIKTRQAFAAAARMALGNDLYSRLRLRSLQLRSNRRAFTEIYQRNLWGAPESVSGEGSSLESSALLRESLPQLLAELKAKSLLDAGCGDFSWMKTVDLCRISYIGVDVVEPLIRRNAGLYGSGGRTFLFADLTKHRLPATDVALCRHCFIHLSNRQVCLALRNLKTSGTKYLLATTSPGVTLNNDIWPGSFRPINLRIAPFHLPEPLCTLHDARGSDQSAILALWRFADLSHISGRVAWFHK